MNMTVNASKSVHLGRRVMRKCQRSLHVVSSAIENNGGGPKTRLPWSRKQGHSSFFAAASEEQLPEFRQPSAEDIQRLLRNIGAGHRASHSAIESMIRRTDAHDGDESTVTADEMIDLIAQIRSL
mmetsp:Transcript_14050/g.34031  ORF Transcript_14050/g.34031 Transcript_14050/m.34031 type:complete len:125 (-) Transcript_14050:93-467(-)